MLRLFYAINVGGEAKPNPITIVTPLPVCACLLNMDAGKSTYVIKSGWETDTLVENALVSLYA